MDMRFTGAVPEKEMFQVIGETFEQLFEEDQRVVYLDADLMGSLKTQELWKKYPHNVFNCGIQEANMVGVACGMYLNGFKPYIHTFTPFASRRVFDQLFISVAYAKKSIRVIGSDAGIMATHNGGTHMCFEDIAMMRTVPNACIVDVSDPSMMRAFMRLSKDYPGLTYLRTARRGAPDIYMDDTPFEIGKAKVLRTGDDVTLIGCGIMVATCLKAADLLEKDGIHARVIDVVTIKPLDTETILRAARDTELIVTAENANVIGGLGGAVSEFLSENCPTHVIKVGINDCFGCVGSEAFLREKYGLTEQHIVDKVKKQLVKRRG